MSNTHIDDDGKHVEQIARRLTELKSSTGKQGESDDIDEMFHLVHTNGWTTLQDVLFVNALIDAAEASLRQTSQLRAALLSGARSISEAAEVRV
jgi:hypothetical protein